MGNITAETILEELTALVSQALERAGITATPAGKLPRSLKQSSGPLTLPTCRSRITGRSFKHRTWTQGRRRRGFLPGCLLEERALARALPARDATSQPELAFELLRQLLRTNLGTAAREAAELRQRLKDLHPGLLERYLVQRSW